MTIQVIFLISDFVRDLLKGVLLLWAQPKATCFWLDTIQICS